MALKNFVFQRKGAGLLKFAITENREAFILLCKFLSHLPCVVFQKSAHLKVFQDSHIGKDAPPFRHQGYPLFYNSVRRGGTRTHSAAGK